MTDPGSGFDVQGSASSVPERDTDMTVTYVRVVIVEAVILVALWLLGRAFY